MRKARAQRTKPRCAVGSDGDGGGSGGGGGDRGGGGR